MLMKFAILVCLFIVNASAYTLDTSSTSVYRKDFGIFVYGDIESIENAFILIQAVATSSKLQTIIALFMLFFLPYTAYKMSSSGTFKPLFTNLTYVTASILTMSTATVPSASIHIEDLRTETIYTGLPAQTYAKIDNIPYPIALVTSTVSTITDSLMILYEDATALLKPDLVGASSIAIGSGNAINDLIKILQFSSFDRSNDEATNLFVRSFTAYVEQCGLKQALNVNPDLVINFKNPSKDLFKSIDPSSLGITGSSYTLNFIDSINGEKSYQCDVFWNNNVISQYATVASKLKERLSKVLTGNLDSPDVVHSYLTLGGTINDTVISSEIGKMDAFIINAASRAPLSKAFANTAIDMSSGQDLANRITAGASLAEMQMQGAGQMKWISEVLPFGYHFMLGIIYSISMLVMIVATAFGYEKGFVIWKNFTKGLTTYEFIKISLVIVNSSVNQYTSKHAADFIASLGSNPATIDSIPYYYNYMATMSGVAGTLGVIAILSIPAMVFSGEVSMAMSALGSIAGKYKGNDTRTSQEVTAEQKSKQEAYERELQDQAMLDRLGISAPAGMGASEFYSMYKKGAEVANSSWGAQRMGTNALADAGLAIKGQTMQGVSAGATVGTHTAMGEFVSSGVSGGLRHSGGIKGEGNALADFGEDSIMLSAELGAYTQSAEGVKMTEGRVNAGLANGSDGRLTSKALKSMGRRAGFDSANLAAMADAKYTDKNGNDLTDKEAFALRGKAATGQSAEMPIKDAAYIKTAMDSDGGLNHKYASGLGTSEEAKFASVKGVGALSSADQDRYVKASENASTIKAAQTIGDTEGQMKQYGDEAKKAGKELADVIRDVANTVAQGKTASTFGSVEGAGGAQGYIDTSRRKASADMGALTTTMSTADKEYVGGYEAFMMDSAALATGQKAGSTRQQLQNLTSANMEKLHDDLLSKTDAKGNKFIKDPSSLDDMRNADGTYKSGVAAAAWFAAKESGNKEGMHGLAIDGNKVGIQLGVDGARITEMSSVSKINTGTSKTDDSSIKIESQESIRSGSVIDTGQSVAASAFAYNIANPNHKVQMNPNGTIDYKNTSKENLGHFMQNIQNKDFTEETKRNMIGELVAGVSDATGLSPEESMALGGATVVGLFAGKPLWNSMKPKNSMPNKTSNNNDSGHAQSAKNESHGNSFHDDIKNYTEEYGASKELFDKESRNLDDLKGQRGRIDDDHPRAHKLDEQIAESEKRMGGHKHDMEIADRNVKATKHLASKPEGHISNMSGAKKGLLGAFAMSAVNNAFEEFGVNTSNSQALLTLNEASNFTDDTLSAGMDLIGGATKAGLRLFTGGDSWGALKGGISTAASKVADSYNNNMTNNDERFQALQAQNTVTAAQNDSGLAPAIDAYNSQQNVSALQKMQPNTIATMQTRGGEMSLMKNSKSGNLDIHLPGQTFAENTGIPYSNFQDFMSNPAQAQQFAQMAAKSNFDGQSGGGVASATDMEQLKNEMNTNFQRSTVQTMNLRSSTSTSAMEIENTREIIEDQLTSSIDSIEETLEDVQKRLERR